MYGDYLVSCVRLFAAAVVLGAVLLPAPLNAQSTRDRVFALEAELQALRAEIAEDNAARMDAGELRRLLADLNVQIGAVERQLRTLTGRAEELEFRNRELRSELDLLRREVTTLSAAGARTQAPEASTSSATPAAPVANATPRPAPAAPTVALPQGDAATQFQYAFDFIRRNDLENGRKAMELFLQTNPDGEIKGNGHFWLGRVNLQMDRPGEAARQFLLLIDNFPDHEKRPDALFELAQVLLQLDSGNEACSALAELQRTRDKASRRLLDRATRLAASAQCD